MDVYTLSILCTVKSIDCAFTSLHLRLVSKLDL
jgi:hypothetical protein